MWLMLQEDTPDDYVVATGDTRTLAEFVEEAFSCVNLDWRDHVKTDPSLFRPTDIRHGAADPSKAKSKLGWQAKKKLREVVKLMVEGEARIAGSEISQKN
jgi:GDPmannose 4,6-dehydratase